MIMPKKKYMLLLKNICLVISLSCNFILIAWGILTYNSMIDYRLSSNLLRLKLLNDIENLRRGNEGDLVLDYDNPILYISCLDSLCELKKSGDSNVSRRLNKGRNIEIIFRSVEMLRHNNSRLISFNLQPNEKINLDFNNTNDTFSIISRLDKYEEILLR